MPLYNTERYVAESIESVLAQTFRDFELIVVDDCSTDGSYAVAESYARRDPRIRLLRNERNLGVAGAKNRGLDAVRGGEYVAFMDSDDLAAPDRLEKQIAFLRAHPEIGVCGSGYTIFYPDGRRNFVPVPTDHIGIAVEMLFGNPMAMPSIMWRRAQVGDARFDTACKAEDYKMWTDLQDRMQLANLPDNLLYYRRWESQVSSGQSDALERSAREIQRSLFRRKLALAPTDEELELWFRMSQHTGRPARSQIAAYARLLRRVARANGQTGAYDGTTLKETSLLHFKWTCRRSLGRWETGVQKAILKWRL